MCMENILQVIELGLSGNKSDNNSDSLKEYKTQKPISGRVCDIAEYLMFVILEHWPSIHLDNKFLPSTIVEQDIDNLNCTYFILDNKAIISCINISNKDKVPSCLVFIRGIMGKHVYQFELKSTLNSDSFDNQNNERKLMNMEEFALETIILKNPNTFETVSNIWKPCQADNSILTFSKYMLNKENELSFLLEQYDAELSNETKSIELYKKTLINSREHALRNVSSPIFKGSYDTYRMLLNNLMMIRMDVEKVNNLEFPYNFCKVPTTQEFIFDLACYDCISIRNTEFAYLFVVNCFNNSVEDILSHEDSLNTNLYNEFIRDLGEEVVVKSHNGYLGPFNS
uniref:Ral GTPase-activating protein subunit beta (Trinotate prediction) n=1 Tax=Henneguya salminicola TaxID=69463 RepID=A0A6G3ME23_HENSL